MDIAHLHTLDKEDPEKVAMINSISVPPWKVVFTSAAKYVLGTTQKDTQPE